MLGLGSSEATILLPRVIDELATSVRVVDVCAGDNHCLALSQDCSVYAWGVNKVGQCGLGHTNTPIVTPQKLKALEGKHIHQISAGTAHSTAWTALPKDRRFVLWHKPFCADLRPDTFVTLYELLRAFGSEWSRSQQPPAPFASRLEQQSFVACVLRLLCCHVTLADASRQGGENGSVGRVGQHQPQKRAGKDNLPEAERDRLEKILYRLVDVNCPSDILPLIHGCLNRGAGLLLPNLETRLARLATLLDLQELSDGQELNLKLLLQSVDDPVVVADILAASYPSPDAVSWSETSPDEMETRAFVVLKKLLVRTYDYYVSAALTAQSLL